MHPFSDPSSHLWTPPPLRADASPAPAERGSPADHGWHSENYAAILQACGDLRDKHVLDFGFGTGRLARILDLLGGSVDAVDRQSSLIPRLREEHPSVYWFATDLRNWRRSHNDIPYDLIVACETLARDDFDEAMSSLLPALSPGGRIVILLANLASRRELPDGKQDGGTHGIPQHEFPTRLSRHLGTTAFSYRGVYRNADHAWQRYHFTEWTAVSSEMEPRHGHPEPDQWQIVGIRLKTEDE